MGFGPFAFWGFGGVGDDVEEFADEFAVAGLGEAAEDFDVALLLGAAAGDFDEDVVAHERADGAVAGLGPLLAPFDEAFEDDEAEGVEFLAAFEAEGALFERGVVVGFVFEAGEFFADPGHAVGFVDLADEAFVDLGEVEDIFDGVADLVVGERSAEPVGEGLSFGDAFVEQHLDQAEEAQGVAIADEAGGELDVEDVVGEESGRAEADLEVFLAGVDDGDDVGVGDEFPEGGDIDVGDGVDEDDLAVAADLDEAEGGVIGFVADEFGIEGEEAGVAPALAVGFEGLLIRNEGGLGHVPLERRRRRFRLLVRGRRFRGKCGIVCSFVPRGGARVQSSSVWSPPWSRPMDVGRRRGACVRCGVLGTLPARGRFGLPSVPARVLEPSLGSHAHADSPSRVKVRAFPGTECRQGDRHQHGGTIGAGGRGA